MRVEGCSITPPVSCIIQFSYPSSPMCGVCGCSHTCTHHLKRLFPRRLEPHPPSPPSATQHRYPASFMSFPIRPSIHVTRGEFKPCELTLKHLVYVSEVVSYHPSPVAGNVTRGGTYMGGLSDGDDSDIKVIVPLSCTFLRRADTRDKG